MTRERADNVYQQHCDSGKGDHDRTPLRSLLTAEESQAVSDKWEAMDGSSSWMDAFYSLMSPEKLPPYMKAHN